VSTNSVWEAWVWCSHAWWWQGKTETFILLLGCSDHRAWLESVQSQYWLPINIVLRVSGGNTFLSNWFWSSWETFPFWFKQRVIPPSEMPFPVVIWGLPTFFQCSLPLWTLLWPHPALGSHWILCWLFWETEGKKEAWCKLAWQGLQSLLRVNLSTENGEINFHLIII
jgi:hypothetical protein